MLQPKTVDAVQQRCDETPKGSLIYMPTTDLGEQENLGFSSI